MSHRNAYSSAAIRELEALLIQREGIDSNALMERAGNAAFECARRHFPDARRWIVIAGAGNNAGDGFVIARLAKHNGIAVETLLLSPESPPRGDAATQCGAMRQAGVRTRSYEGGDLPDSDLIVDAMLGIGLSRPLTGRYLEAVRAVNLAAAPVLAVDIPTGIHADSGACMGAAVRSALTVTFVAEKCGQFLGDAPDHTGVRVLEPLGHIPDEIAQEVESGRAGLPGLRIFTGEDRRAMLPQRRRADHKGRFGHVLVIGGGLGMGGAARLAGEGALRAGAGLVSVATHPKHVAALLAERPELMVRGIREAEELAPLVERATVLAVGCGLGQDDWARGLFEAACGSNLPAVVDADGLGLLAESLARGGSRASATPLIITPHPGEAARMLGRSAAEVQEDRLGAVSDLRRSFGGVALLKGAHTLVSGSERPPWVIDAGNPGMATAGMGDVLTGLLAGLWAQLPGANPEDLAALAAHVHACAGDIAARSGQRGMIASDLLAAVRDALNPGQRGDFSRTPPNDAGALRAQVC